MQQHDPQPLFEGASGFATKLMMLTAISVPWILGPKPFLMKSAHESKEKVKNAKKAAQKEEFARGRGKKVEDLSPEENKEFDDVEDVDDDDDHGGGHGHGGGFEFGEVMIHQIIETIEFVLGTVSHTASYLRIWALSLAHQQLSLVFYEKTMTNGLQMDFPFNMFALYFLFAIWFGITIGVLIFMDVLECFLHTLRLHWVEFQSKFYMADGYPFEPYNIRSLLLPAKGV